MGMSDCLGRNCHRTVLIFGPRGLGYKGLMSFRVFLGFRVDFC